MVLIVPCALCHPSNDCEDPTTYKSKARISGKEKCDACKFDFYDKDQVIVHTIKMHMFKLCLQCDDTIEKKKALFLKTFDFQSIGPLGRCFR